jgi:hypothetical protein
MFVMFFSALGIIVLALFPFILLAVKNRRAKQMDELEDKLLSAEQLD